MDETVAKAQAKSHYHEQEIAKLRKFLDDYRDLFGTPLPAAPNPSSDSPVARVRTRIAAFDASSIQPTVIYSYG
ncbi:MAG: hypothetical protein ACK5XA_08145, partial [Tagaea sp.]